MKIFYSYFVSDNVYHFYKFSIYGSNKITLVAAGLAYDNRGNYSKEFNKLKEKYQPVQGMMNTSHNYADFIGRLYLDSAQTKITAKPIDVHPILYKIFESEYNFQEEQLEKNSKNKALRFLSRSVEPIVGKIEDDVKDEMCRFASVYFK